jgi:hypothetical protein
MLEDSWPVSMKIAFRNFIQACGRMFEDSWPVSMKIAFSVKMAGNSFVVLRIIF